MSSKGNGKGLKRVADLYTVVERMRSAELRMAADEVRAMERAVSDEITRRIGDVTGARAALAEGAREWRMAEVTRGGFEIRMGHLLELKAERELALNEAVMGHRVSLIHKEQMIRMMERLETTEKLQESRRSQAVADDAFGAMRSAAASMRMRS